MCFEKEMFEILVLTEMFLMIKVGQSMGKEVFSIHVEKNGCEKHLHSTPPISQNDNDDFFKIKIMSI